MSAAPEEGPRPSAGGAGSDAVTLAFADPRAGVYGMARTGVGAGGASGLAVLFRAGEVVAARVEGGVPVAGEGWDGVRAAGVRTEVLAPHERWRTTFDAGDQGGFALEATALGAPAELGPESPTGAAGGLEGHEHLVRVRGVVTAGGERIEIDGRGQRGRAWGAPDWNRIALARAIGLWMGDDLGVVLTAVRPAKAREHDGEAIDATVLEGGPLLPWRVAQPRLSTTYDADGRQRKAGLELWPEGEDALARRAVGEVVAGTSLDLGRLRLDLAFFRFRMDGREGVGRYEIVRRA